MNPITYQDQTLTIIPWSNSYRAETTSWTLPVSIKILGIPPHALWRNHPKLLGPGALIFVAKQL